MIHHDSALFQKVGTTSLRIGSLSCMDVLYLSPGAPLECPPSYLLPQEWECSLPHPITAKSSLDGGGDQVEGSVSASVWLSCCPWYCDLAE